MSGPALSAPGQTTSPGGWLPRLVQQLRQSRLGRLHRQLGGVNLLLYLVDRGLQAISGGRARLIRYHILAQPIGAGVAARLRPDPRTRLEMVPQDDALLAAFPRPVAVIAARYAQGGHCLAATVDGAFAGYLWWQRDRYEEDEVRCSFVLRDPARCVWDYDLYVEPRLRLGRTMARLWQAADERLAAQGVRWSLSRISAFNPGSLTAHARLGTVHCESASFVVIGGLQLALLAQLPYLHLSLRGGARPQLKLGPP